MDSLRARLLQIPAELTREEKLGKLPRPPGRHTKLCRFMESEPAGVAPDFYEVAAAQSTSVTSLGRNDVQTRQKWKRGPFEHLRNPLAAPDQRSASGGGGACRFLSVATDLVVRSLIPRSSAPVMGAEPVAIG